MSLNIHSTDAISPLDTFSGDKGHGQPRGMAAWTAREEGKEAPAAPYMSCLHPDYKKLVKPSALRRMSPVIRMGLASAVSCLEQSGLDKPGAILVGSGLGCVRDTVRFLEQVTGQEEQLLNPTAFIQSTHNTVSGQIALTMGCRAANFTFSQKSLSFESALLEAMMRSKEDPSEGILLGGVDEVTEESHRLMVEGGCMKPLIEPDLYNSPTPGAAAGEGAAFFMVSGTPHADGGAAISDLEMVYGCPAGGIPEAVMRFLARNGCDAGGIDLLVSGRGGDATLRDRFRQVEALFPGSHVAGYKHLTGDYDTATALGLHLAVGMMEHHRVPGLFSISAGGSQRLDRVLLFNITRERDLSLILLKSQS